MSGLLGLLLGKVLGKQSPHLVNQGAAGTHLLKPRFCSIAKLAAIGEALKPPPLFLLPGPLVGAFGQTVFVLSLRRFFLSDALHSRMAYHQEASPTRTPSVTSFPARLPGYSPHLNFLRANGSACGKRRGRSVSRRFAACLLAHISKTTSDPLFLHLNI